MMKRRKNGKFINVPEDEEAKIRSQVTESGETGPLLEAHGPYDVVMTDDEAKAFRAERAQLAARDAAIVPVLSPIERLAKKLGLSSADIDDILGRK